MMNYKERYLAGEIEFEAIDDYSYEWGMGDASQNPGTVSWPEWGRGGRLGKHWRGRPAGAFG